MSISLFSGQNQPYGLLSNNAFTPIMIDTVRYFSVTDYVYRNLFTDPESKQLMINRINRNPYSAAVEIKTEANKQLFIDAICLGMKARFAYDAKFKAGIKALGDQTITVKWGTEDENRRLTMLFNQFIHSPAHVFFDKNYGEVSFETVNAVVAGVAEKLLKDSQMPSLPFSKLRDYAVRNAAPRLDLVSALANLDEIVPVLKIKLKDKIYASDLERFKARVLDVTLTHVLKSSYPQIAEEDYVRAKAQQMAKNRKVISKYETDLYNLYMSGALPPAIMNNADLARLNPNVPASSVVTVNAIETELEASNPNLPGLLPTVIEYPDYLGGPKIVPEELLPSAKTHIPIKDAEYDSVVAYAYAVLFDSIKRQAGHVPLEKLSEAFNVAEHEVRVTRLKELNEKATRAKFAADDSLVQLLLATENKKLIYSDLDDAVLGIRSPGMNAAGEFLEVLRAEYATKVKLTATRFTTPFDNIVVNEWFKSRAVDYANTLKMFKTRQAQDLAMIYNIHPEYIAPDSISAESKELITKLMNAAGLSDVEQSLVLPFMVADFRKIQDGGVPAICASYDQHQPTKDERFNADTRLTKIYNIVKSRLYQQEGGTKRPQMKKITALMFVTRILSNQEDGNINQDQWWRINKWNKQSRQVLLRLGE